jgi:phosphoglycerate dehydrogenase-like enzyme
MKLAILDDYQKVALRLGDWGRLPAEIAITVFDRHLGDEDAVAAALADFEIVVAMRERTPFPRSLLARLPKLKLLITTGMRNNAIDLAAAEERGVAVSGTSSAGSPTAALAWGLILSLARRIPQEDAALRAGRWQTSLGVDLEGKTLGVIGLGKLGSTVARIGQAFGMEAIAWSQNLTPERASELGVGYAGKEDLLRRADVVSIHVVLSERTRGLLGADDLAVMKPTAFLVNTSRGPIVDQAALIAALKEGRIAGAGLDVYDREPLPPDHPLLAAPNTVLTPHLGYVTEENYRAYVPDVVEDVLAFLDGKPVRLLTAPHK